MNVYTNLIYIYLLFSLGEPLRSIKNSRAVLRLRLFLFRLRRAIRSITRAAFISFMRRRVVPLLSLSQNRRQAAESCRFRKKKKRINTYISSIYAFFVIAK